MLHCCLIYRFSSANRLDLPVLFRIFATSLFLKRMLGGGKIVVLCKSCGQYMIPLPFFPFVTCLSSGSSEKVRFFGSSNFDLKNRCKDNTNTQHKLLF
jgi:hypothetical protein